LASFNAGTGKKRTWQYGTASVGAANLVRMRPFDAGKSCAGGRLGLPAACLSLHPVRRLLIRRLATRTAAPYS
jgi:hypothetical protein